MEKADLIRRIQEYAQPRGLLIGKQLGCGVDGIVFDAENQSKTGLSALKGHGREDAYVRERNVYLRLKQKGVSVVRDCNIPKLLDFDDHLWILEMTVVARPFVLDFAAAQLDRAPDFSAEVIAEWRKDKHEQFGCDWARVQSILRALEVHGIFLTDVHPGNVSIGE